MENGWIDGCMRFVSSSSSFFFFFFLCVCVCVLPLGLAANEKCHHSDCILPHALPACMRQT